MRGEEWQMQSRRQKDMRAVGDLVSGTLSEGQSQTADFMIEVVFNIHLFSNRHQPSQVQVVSTWRDLERY